MWYLAMYAATAFGSAGLAAAAWWWLLRRARAWVVPAAVLSVAFSSVMIGALGV